jgi:hypothetical protein
LLPEEHFAVVLLAGVRPESTVGVGVQFAGRCLVRISGAFSLEL